MQPLNWEFAARTPLSESFNIYAAVDSVRPATESFGDHLYRSNSTPLPLPPEPARETLKPAVTTPLPAPQTPTRSGGAPDVNTNSYTPASGKTEHAKDSRSIPNDQSGSKSAGAPAEQPKNSSSDQDVQAKQPAADSEDNKTAQASRSRSHGRRLATKFQQEIDSGDPASAAEVKAKSKGVKAAAGKAKQAGKNKHGDPADPSDAGLEDAQVPGQPPTATASVEQQLLDDGSKSSKKKGSSAAPADAEQTSVDQAASALVETLPMEPVECPVGTSSIQQANVGKRSQRGPSEAAGAGAIAEVNSASPASQVPNELVMPLEEAAALLDSAETTAGTNSGKSSESPNANAPVSSPTSPQMRFAQHLAAKTSTREVKNAPLTDMEHARLIDRVARAFQTAEAKGGSVTLRLHPPELGSLRVELRVTDGVLSARLEAETPTARTVLLDNVQMLHDRLAEQGVRIERFDVDLSDHRSADTSAGFEQNGTQEQNQRQQPAPTRTLELQDNDATPSSPRPFASGNLNVII